jgi:hypothetical protein
MKAEADPASAKAYKTSIAGWEISAAVKVSFVSVNGSLAAYRMAERYVQDRNWHPFLPRSGPMTARARQEDEENEKTAQASTPHLEKLASAAAAAA